MIRPQVGTTRGECQVPLSDIYSIAKTEKDFKMMAQKNPQCYNSSSERVNQISSSAVANWEAMAVQTKTWITLSLYVEVKR